MEYVQVNEDNGVPLFTTFIEEKSVDQILSMHQKAMELDFIDIPWIEKKINAMMKGNYKFKKINICK